METEQCSQAKNTRVIQQNGDNTGSIRIVDNRANGTRKNETGLPDNLKAGVESLSGFSLDNVRVHYNSSKPATVQALAYTQGTDIHVAPGQEKHLPHEAWHVAQQMAGRVAPTTSVNGMPVNDNAALEHEADVMGEKALMQRKRSTKPDYNSMENGGKREYDQCRKDFYDLIPAEDKSHGSHGKNFKPWEKRWTIESIADDYLRGSANLNPKQKAIKQQRAAVVVAQMGKGGFVVGDGNSWHVHPQMKKEDCYHIKYRDSKVYFAEFYRTDTRQGILNKLRQSITSNSGIKNPGGITDEMIISPFKKTKVIDKKNWLLCMNHFGF